MCVGIAPERRRAGSVPATRCWRRAKRWPGSPRLSGPDRDGSSTGQDHRRPVPSHPIADRHCGCTRRDVPARSDFRSTSGVQPSPSDRIAPYLAGKDSPRTTRRSPGPGRRWSSRLPLNVQCLAIDVRRFLGRLMACHAGEARSTGGGQALPQVVAQRVLAFQPDGEAQHAGDDADVVPLRGVRLKCEESNSVLASVSTPPRLVTSTATRSARSTFSARAFRRGRAVSIAPAAGPGSRRRQ
jgi:hypothetical protein